MGKGGKERLVPSEEGVQRLLCGIYGWKGEENGILIVSGTSMIT